MQLSFDEIIAYQTYYLIHQMSYRSLFEGGGGALKLADLNDYQNRLGKQCPTPQDAMIFSGLNSRLATALKPKDLLLYDEAIKNKDKDLITKYDNKF
jgi:hypothetical protein